MRWPSIGTPRPEGWQADQELLDACARLLSPDGHTVAILAPPAGGIYRDYARTQIAAAACAGIGYLQHVVVITGYPPDDKQGAGQDTGPDRNPDDDSGADMDDGPRASRCESSREHLDLLVLVLSPSRTAGAPTSGIQRRPAWDFGDSKIRPTGSIPHVGRRRSLSRTSLRATSTIDCYTIRPAPSSRSDHLSPHSSVVQNRARDT